MERKLGSATSKALVRPGAGYEFHVGRFTVGPGVVVDFVEDNSRVIYGGVFAGIGF